MDLNTIDWQSFTVDVELSGSIVAGAEPDPGVLGWSGSAQHFAGAEGYEDETTLDDLLNSASPSCPGSNAPTTDAAANEACLG